MMTNTIKYNPTPKLDRRIVNALLILFVIGCLPAAAQERYLDKTTVQGPEEEISISANIISSQAATQFTVIYGAKATLTASRRIELHPGFKVLEKGRLTALVGTLEPTEDSQEKAFAVFPNPTAGIVNVTSVHNVDAARLIDLTGYAVWEQKLIGAPQFNLNISSVRPGIYILELISGKLVQKVRIEKK